MKKQARHTLVETVTVNKQIRKQVPLIVPDKQQLTTINKQKRIISVFVSRQLRQIWTFRGPPTQYLPWGKTLANWAKDESRTTQSRSTSNMTANLRLNVKYPIPNRKWLWKTEHHNEAKLTELSTLFYLHHQHTYCFKSILIINPHWTATLHVICS
jgi:hypothetical protein